LKETDMTTIRAWTAESAGSPFALREFDPGPLGPEEVEVRVEHCGICHSDLSMWDNDWGMTRYPFVPGHEAIGTVVALGDQAKGLRIGQRVGVGWNAGSCLHCGPCIDGDQHLCSSVQPTIVGRHGAFAERVRAHWLWAVPLPDGLSASDAGPLLCGGITVFAPLLIHGVPPTARVAVVGIGGLGHLALKFLAAWGCEVTAFTSSAAKHDEARALGAHRVASSTDGVALKQLAGAFDLLIVTVNAALDWRALVATLAPKGRLHVVGAVPEPIPVVAFDLLMGQRAIAGSPTGSRGAIDTMLAFADRHGILPQTEHFPMRQVNEAMNHLREGKARYRIVLDADFS
jgi:uncharacterized zinc-type alcohol dehydrogenase-like protein